MAINFREVVGIVETLIPLYFSMVLAYISVRWMKIFSPEQCSGINRFLRVFAIPLLYFKLVASNDLYTINLKLFAADTLQKMAILLTIFGWKMICKNGSLEWVATFYSLSCFPNSLIIGLPILKAMYGAKSAAIIIQTVVFQGVVWINVLLVLFEYRAAKLLLSKQFLKSGDSIASFRVDSDVFSLSQIQSSSSRGLSFNSAEMVSCNGGRSGVDMGDGICCSDELGVIVDESMGGEVRSGDGGRSAIDGKMEERPPARVVGKLIVCMVLKKIMRNPNTYSSVLGLLWSLLSFKYKIRMPSVVLSSISTVSDTGLVLSMFSLGLFMGSQPNIISCRLSEAVFAMIARFVVAPGVMAATSWAVGLRGIILHTTIIQAALPQAIVCFVYAKEYDVHPKILSTSVIVGMVIALPIVICYYIILGI